MIETTTTPGPEILEFDKRHKFIAGNAWEIEATLDACLQIHRWTRAFALLGQLRVLYGNNHVQLQRLYNKVLEAMVLDCVWNRTTENATRINTWVEGTMGKAGIQPNARTFALKIKAALATLEGSRRDRTVRRYWDMAKEYNVDWEVASLRDILSDSDLGKLSEISPAEFSVEEASVGIEEDTITTLEDVIAQPPVPQVLETEQKGLGMWALKKSLSLFGDASHLSEWDQMKNADPESRQEYARRRQLQLERDSLTSAAERWRIEHEKMAKMGISSNASHGHVGALIWKWHQQLATNIEAELEKVDKAEASTKRSDEERLRCEYGPFLRLLTPQHLAALTVTSVIQLLTKVGSHTRVRLARLVTDLGRTVEQEVEAERKKQEKKHKETMRLARDKQQSSEDSVSLSHSLPSTSSRRPNWSVIQYGKVGSILCELLFESCKIRSTQQIDGADVSIFQPAFHRHHIFANGKQIAVVHMHNEMSELLSKEPVTDLISKQMPMICEPAKWVDFQQGGYLDVRNSAVRVKFLDRVQEEYSRAAAERGDLDQIFASMDVLGQTGWRINKNVFNVMVEAWNTGEAIANLPPLNKAFPDLPEPTSDATAREKYQYYKTMEIRKNEKGGIHSNRCFQNFQLEIARAYLNETFYLPHNLDFRGRAYPIPPYLNQMGADNARALMIFDVGRPLGPKGLMWLKVHFANVCGYDKASLTDRAKYADDHMDDIRDSVQNPLNGRKWWLQAEDPWQCLATCYELVQAIDSGDPETFVSHLPVHQDGTCNGLQHYAALGGDIAGARQVNLEPGDKPADVYTGVAELVKADIKHDAEAGDELARALEGRVTRKVVKQTVMTNVYGVTFNGAMHQVRRQLDALYPDLNERKLASPASLYIARKIFKGLGKLFEGAHDIQYWFGDCATRITNSISLAQLEEVERSQAEKAEGVAKQVDKRLKRDVPLHEREAIEQSDFRSTVIWTTPLKLPVVQPYRVSRAQQIKTHMASIVLAEPSITDSVDKRKQLQAFPPNYIHSLDATHMMLSALKAKELGLTFSAVHDSFWTHAADVDTLNTLLRDAFIRMHSEDIVGRLAAEFEARYKGHLYLAKVQGNSPLAQRLAEFRERVDVSGVKTSSSSKEKKKAQVEKKRQFWELMQEYKRQKLLNSSDPAEQEKGRQMVTAASIFEEFDGEHHLVNKNSLGETALGKIPESQVTPETEVIQEALTHDEIDEGHDVDLEATLEPLVDDTRDSTYKCTTIFPTVTPKKRGRKKGVKLRDCGHTSQITPTWVWLPLTFKSIPKKGEWDVRRLKESTYFFS